MSDMQIYALLIIVGLIILVVWLWHRIATLMPTTADPPQDDEDEHLGARA